MLASERPDRRPSALLQSLRARVGDAAPDVAALLAPARGPSHPGALCARRSPGPRSLTRPSASGAWASRGAPASTGCAGSGENPCWWTTRRRHPSSTGSRCSRPTRAGSSACCAARWWSRARVSAATARSGAARTRPAWPYAAGSASGWSRPTRTRVVCITGTKGKSTTTALAVHLLARAGLRGQGRWQHRPPALGPVDRRRARLLDSRDLELPGPRPRPRPAAGGRHVALPDHLDWHGSVERYYADKLSLATKPGVELVLANGTDGELRRNAAAFRPAGALGGGRRERARPDLGARTGPPRPSQRRQRGGGEGRARRTRSRGRVRRRSSGRRRRIIPWPSESLSHHRSCRRRRVRRRQPVDERAPDSGRPRSLRRPPGRAPRGGTRPRASTTRRSDARWRSGPTRRWS